MADTLLLVGNGSHLNRGCEAIFQGTRRILRDVFGADLRLRVGSFCSDQDLEWMRSRERDPLVEFFNLEAKPKSPTHVMRKLSRMSGLALPGAYPRLDPRSAMGALEVGGDNYSFDYGIPPLRFIELDNLLIRKGVPVCIWGASVGPFERSERYKPVMLEHLRKITTIYAREPHTIAYLAENGVADNVQQMADPAFLMLPEAPPSNLVAAVPEGAIGLNLSPLMATYVCKGDAEAWYRLSIQLAEAVLENTTEDLLLIPHVTDIRHNPRRDDYLLLERVRNELAARYGSRLHLLPPTLSAPQLKYCISRCRCFIGARTHATIAAFSSNVPTISLAYSIKASGLNQDIYGTLDYCINPELLTPERLISVLKQVTAERESMIVKTTAYNAAAYAMIHKAASHLKLQLTGA